MNIMPESTGFSPDPLDELLRPSGAASDDETLRPRLLDQTTLRLAKPPAPACCRLGRGAGGLLRCRRTDGLLVRAATD